MDFSCTKCGSTSVYIDDSRGTQKALMCKECGSWLKWIGKKDIPLAVKFIKEHNDFASIRLNPDNAPTVYPLKVDRIKDLEDVKRVLQFLKIEATVSISTEIAGYELVKDLFE